MNNLIDEQILARWLGDSEGTVAEHPILQSLDLIFAADPNQECVQRAKRNLERALRDNHEYVVYYDKFSHPLLGEIYAATTDKGLFALDFGLNEGEFINQIEVDRAIQSHGQARIGRFAIRSPKRIRPILEQVHAYLDGNRSSFELSLDLSGISEFHRQVLLATCQVPHGQVVTYAEIARKVGKPRAARAVGQALRHNPIPLIIPCHRVIASDGSLRGYKGQIGLETKAFLLRMEGYHLHG
ncbi:MAG: methylated-DNA--[protein]-cysteine S-methyltransferase [Anaerolineales bacterium]|nr:methylated-DNA--[protein]-cysteine S-methyltransferase [Anaerolineales bacterium]